MLGLVALNLLVSSGEGPICHRAPPECTSVSPPSVQHLPPWPSKANAVAQVHRTCGAREGSWQAEDGIHAYDPSLPKEPGATLSWVLPCTLLMV